jgi:hypothetical protein
MCNTDTKKIKSFSFVRAGFQMAVSLYNLKLCDITNYQSESLHLLRLQIMTGAAV